MSSSEATGETSGSLQNIPATYARIKRQYQQLLDRVTPHVLYRWIGTTVTVALFELRILYAQGVRVSSYHPRSPSFTHITFLYFLGVFSGTLVCRPLLRLTLFLTMMIISSLLCVSSFS